MAISFDNSGILNDSGPNGSQAFTIASGSNRLLIATAMTNRSISGIAWNGTALTMLTNINNANQISWWWYLVAPETGTHNISFTGASAGSFLIAYMALQGVSQTQPIGAYLTEQENAVTSTALDLTLTFSNSWTVETQGAEAPGGVTITQDSGQTQRDEAHPGLTLASATKSHTNPGSTTLGFSVSGGDNLHHIAVEVVDVTQTGVPSFFHFLPV